MIARAIPLSAIAVCCLTAGCENSLLDRSLVFFTNTTMGIEISVSPSDATAPVKLIIGYKRSEGVLNPVYHSQGVRAPATTDESEALSGGSSHTDKNASTSGSSSYSKKWSKSVPIAGGPKTVKRYRWEAYSVIAKIAGEVSGNAGDSADGKLSVAQWFATGEAAKILAKQPGIAGAVTGSAEIAKQAVEEARLGTSLQGEAKSIEITVLSFIDTGLKVLASDGSASVETRKIAASHYAGLQALSVLVPAKYPFTMYQLDSEDATNKNYVPIDEIQEGKPVPNDGFTKVTIYWSDLRGARDILKEMIAVTDLKVSNDQSEHLKKDLLDQLEAVEQQVREFEELVETNPTVLAAVQYYCGLIIGR